MKLTDKDIGTTTKILKKNYERRKKEYWDTHPKHKYADIWFNTVRIKKVFNLIPDERVKLLDLGCGESYYLKVLEDEDHTVIGIDPIYSHVKVSKKIIENVCWGDGYNLPFKPNSFDLVLCLEVVEHLTIKETRRMLYETKKVLKSGGILILSTPRGDTIYKRIGQIIPTGLKSRIPHEPTLSKGPDRYIRGHITEFTPERLSNLLLDLDFKDTKVYGGCINYVPFQMLPIPPENMSLVLSFFDNLTNILPFCQKFKVNFILECRNS